MAANLKNKKPYQVPPVRPAFILDDRSYMTETEFGQTMTRSAAEIAEEQGTRSTEEINLLIELMRSRVPEDVDLSR